MKKIYSIGEETPWRLTKDSGYRLSKAIVETGAEVIASYVDVCSPPLHACIRIRLDEDKISAFKDIFEGPFELVMEAGGSNEEQNILVLDETGEGLYHFCPVCGAHAGQMCSEPDPNEEGLGIEWTHKIHAERVTNTNGLIRICDICKNVTAIDLDNSIDNKKEMELPGQTVLEVPLTEIAERFKSASHCECKKS
ncbi:MAG: hypothetical protein M0R32_09355 [Candidatus Cloacimonetes bacterium]|jgi:hypothetical protein|nr:hypothetical protein [Candidatus Cloacimonadota bacterium]